MDATEVIRFIDEGRLIMVRGKFEPADGEDEADDGAQPPAGGQPKGSKNVRK